MTKVGGAWKISKWNERKVCPGPSGEMQRDQLRWRGWMRPFTGPNERAPAGSWMWVGPSAPHRRAQTSDLENYPGKHFGTVTPATGQGLHGNQALQSAPGSFLNRVNFPSVLKEVRVKSTPRDILRFFLKGEMPVIVPCENFSERCGMQPSGVFLLRHKALFVLATYVYVPPECLCSSVHSI